MSDMVRDKRANGSKASNTGLSVLTKVVWWKYSILRQCSYLLLLETQAGRAFQVEQSSWTEWSFLRSTLLSLVTHRNPLSNTNWLKWLSQWSTLNIKTSCFRNPLKLRHYIKGPRRAFDKGRNQMAAKSHRMCPTFTRHRQHGCHPEAGRTSEQRLWMYFSFSKQVRE